MIDGYEKHTCTECETMFTSNEELQQHHTIDHGLVIENSIEWTDVQPEDKVEETDNGFISNGKKITFSDEDKSIAESYLTETAKSQRVMVASEQRLKLARDEIKASEAETNAFYDQFLGESNGQDFSSGAGTIKPLDTPKFKYSKNKKLADTINTKGYNPNPNAGLYDNKQFKEGGDHLEDPLAKEDFEVSFYSGESKASELGIGSTFNMSGSASDVGEQAFWCEHIGTGGIKCGEPFPDHFNGNIEDHDFYPIAQSTQDQMDGKLNESKANEKYGELTSQQKNVLNNWVNGVKKEEQSSFPHTVLIGLSWEASDLPYDIFRQLEEIQDSEYLYSAITNHVQEKADESKSSEFGDYEVKCDCDKDPDCKTCDGKGTIPSFSFEGKSDESLKADWDDSDYEEKYSWLKDLGVEDAFKYANMTLYELPETVWKIVNEDYVKGFKEMTGESYQPDQKDMVETSEEKIISRKLANIPVGQIARELVLWDNMSAEEAEKMVSETEPNDNDITSQSLFNKKYSELNNNELAEMELYDV